MPSNLFQLRLYQKFKYNVFQLEDNLTLFTSRLHMLMCILTYMQDMYIHINTYTHTLNLHGKTTL